MTLAGVVVVVVIVEEKDDVDADVDADGDNIFAGFCKFNEEKLGKASLDGFG